MSNKYQIKRTTVSGRTPNTTNAANTSFIDAGELAINMTDQKMFSSNGSALIEVGSNLTTLSVTSNTAVGGNLSVTGTVVLTANGILFSDSTVQTTAPLDPVVYAIALG